MGKSGVKKKTFVLAGITGGIDELEIIVLGPFSSFQEADEYRDKNYSIYQDYDIRKITK